MSGEMAGELLRNMKSKWSVFESEQAREIAMNEAKAAKAEATFTDICERSSLDFPGFGKALKLRDATGFRVFGVKVAAKDTDQLLELSLVGDDLSYLFAKVRELLLSGVVTHISIDIGAGVEVKANKALSQSPENEPPR
jgi:hypothetical protein